jgi:hypothetical protein
LVPFSAQAALGGDAEAARADGAPPAPRTAAQVELAQFVAFAREHPGRIFKDDHKEHMRCFNLVLLSEEYVAVKRRAVERLSNGCLTALCSLSNGSLTAL